MIGRVVFAATARTTASLNAPGWPERPSSTVACALADRLDQAGDAAAGSSQAGDPFVGLRERSLVRLHRAALDEQALRVEDEDAGAGFVGG